MCEGSSKDLPSFKSDFEKFSVRRPRTMPSILQRPHPRSPTNAADTISDVRSITSWVASPKWGRDLGRGCVRTPRMKESPSVMEVDVRHRQAIDSAQHVAVKREATEPVEDSDSQLIQIGDYIYFGVRLPPISCITFRPFEEVVEEIQNAPLVA